MSIDYESNMLIRRKIEARIIAPFIKAFIKEIGEEKAINIVKKVIETLAYESGRELAKLLGGNSLEDYAKGLDLWMKDGSLNIEILEKSRTELSFKVTKCLFVELYKELGIPEMGKLLSCDRDFAMIKGFNPNIELVRTKTIMEGNNYCDFLLRIKGGLYCKCF